VGFDDYFDGIFCFGHHSKSKTGLFKRKPVGNHFPKGKALSPYQLDGSCNVKRTAPVCGHERETIIPKIEKGKNEIETRL
jgi:hypothetical protein